MKKAWAVLAVAAAVWAADTGYNFDQQADFGKYKTYQWVELKGGKNQVSEITDRNIIAGIDRELAAKGLVKVTSNADLYVGYQAGFQKNQEYTTFNTGGAGWGWGPGWGMGTGISQTTSNTIVTGQLTLDMYDAAQKRMVWRGTVSDTVQPTNKPDKQLKKLDNAINKMLKNYPPKKK